MLQKVSDKLKALKRARAIRRDDRLEMLEILYELMYYHLKQQPIPGTRDIPSKQDIKDTLECSLRIAAKDKKPCLKDKDVYDLVMFLNETKG